METMLTYINSYNQIKKNFWPFILTETNCSMCNIFEKLMDKLKNDMPSFERGYDKTHYELSMQLLRVYR